MMAHYEVSTQPRLMDDTPGGRAVQPQQQLHRQEASGLSRSLLATANSSPASTSSAFTAAPTSVHDSDARQAPAYSYASTSSLTAQQSPFEAYPSTSSPYLPRHGHSQSVGHLSDSTATQSAGGSDPTRIAFGNLPSSRATLQGSNGDNAYPVQGPPKTPQSQQTHQRSSSAGGPGTPLVAAPGQGPGPLLQHSSGGYTAGHAPPGHTAASLAVNTDRSLNQPHQYLSATVPNVHLQGGTSSGSSSSGPQSRTHTTSPPAEHLALQPTTPTPSGTGGPSLLTGSAPANMALTQQQPSTPMHAAGLGLAGLGTYPRTIYSPSLGPPAGASSFGGSSPYSPGYHLQQSALPLATQQQQHPVQYQQFDHAGTDTPPSPSGESSIRHSLAESMPYTPHTFTSPASSIPSSLHIMSDTGSLANKIAYDVPPSPIYTSHPHRPSLPHHLSGQQHTSAAYPPLSTSLPASFDASQHRGHHYFHSHSSSASSSNLQHLSSQYQQQAQAQLASPPYPLAQSAQGNITVYSASPAYGAANSQLYVEIGVAHHEPHYIRGFRVLFGSHGTTTRVGAEHRVEGGERVELVATIPPIQLTNRIPANGSTCQLTLQALDEAGNVADWADLGVFEYTDMMSPSKGNKRPGSPLSSIRDSPGSQMRPVFSDQAAMAAAHKRGHSRGSSIGSLVNGFGHMSHSRNSSLTSNMSEYEVLQQSFPYSHPLAQSTSSSNLASQSAHWYQSPEGELVERKPIARLRAPVQPPTSTMSSGTLRHPPMEVADANTPTLYRTSQLSNATPNGTPDHATKAVLKFDGDLNNMALGWSHDEWVVKRRLIQFVRRQEGSTISATFKPVSLQEITPNTIVISCIFREDKNECFVTSVDTIYLLEALVSVRFTVEEKNRIRRNLEGYKPITVTKTKPDCENFFKVIMGFPNPKPRNIEKDVKVFPWKILGNALKKIVSKYSASFLAPTEMVGPGKQPPQPIGWAPGRTPPPTGHGANASEGDTTLPLHGSPLSKQIYSTLLPPLADAVEHSNGRQHPMHMQAVAQGQGLGIRQSTSSLQPGSGLAEGQSTPNANHSQSRPNEANPFRFG